MMGAETPDVTRLLHEWSAGNRTAENELFALVMPDLRRVAGYLIRGERKGHSLQATELVNQIYVRLVAARNQNWENRRHFFAIAGRAMRRHLIDHARARPEVDFTTLTGEILIPPAGASLNLALTIDMLLGRMEQVDRNWCQVVEVKYFLGLTDEEAADALDISLRTLQRRWRDARQWLFERLGPENAHRAAP
jgi:RNA polymerase sigma factor (TIGR02999 family)